MATRAPASFHVAFRPSRWVRLDVRTIECGGARAARRLVLQGVAVVVLRTAGCPSPGTRRCLYAHMPVSLDGAESDAGTTGRDATRTDKTRAPVCHHPCLSLSTCVVLRQGPEDNVQRPFCTLDASAAHAPRQESHACSAQRSGCPQALQRPARTAHQLVSDTRPSVCDAVPSADNVRIKHNTRCWGAPQLETRRAAVGDVSAEYSLAHNTPN